MQKPLVIFWKQCYIITMEPNKGQNPVEPNDSDLQALYNSGSDVTISFIKMLLDRIKSLEATVKELEATLSKDSHNSNKPPSQDGLKKKKVIKNLRKKGKKKSGGQPGHQGTNLKLSDNPDIIKEIPVERCENCGDHGHLKPLDGYKRRQVIDIVIKKEIKEYRAKEVLCEKCGAISSAQFPSGVNSMVQYGSSVKAFIIYMRTMNYVSIERIKEMFVEVFNIPLSEGTIINTIQKTSMLLKPFEDYVKEKILEEPVVMFDETGIRIEGSLHWIHSASTSSYTFYFPHKERGKPAMDEMGILPSFQGIAIHDSWQSYFGYSCSHGLCNAHHLRELIFLEEEMNQKWARRMIKLLLEIKEKTDKEKLKGRLIPEKERRYYESRFKRIVREGIKDNPYPVTKKKKRGRKKKGKIRCLLDRFKSRIHQVLAFMNELIVPFDNNQAERDVRMAKLYQKVSGCFRTMAGAIDFLRTRSWLSTLRKNKQNVIGSLKNLFQSGCFNGIPAE